MKLETYLNAMEMALLRRQHADGKKWSKYLRQGLAFRDRIIRMDERKNMRITKLEDRVFYLRRERDELEQQIVRIK